MLLHCANKAKSKNSQTKKTPKKTLTLVNQFKWNALHAACNFKCTWIEWLLVIGSPRDYYFIVRVRNKCFILTKLQPSVALCAFFLLALRRIQCFNVSFSCAFFRGQLIGCAFSFFVIELPNPYMAPVYKIRLFNWSLQCAFAQKRCQSKLSTIGFMAVFILHLLFLCAIALKVMCTCMCILPISFRSRDFRWDCDSLIQSIERNTTTNNQQQRNKLAATLHC